MHLQSKQRSPALYTPPTLLLALIVGISYLGLGFVLPLRALYGRHIGANSVEIGLMASSFLLAGFLATPFVGWLADRFSSRVILALGLLLHTALVLAYIPIQNPIMLITLRAFEGIAAAAVLPPARVLMNTMAPNTRQGEALGLLSASQTVGVLLGPATGALLANRAGYDLSFLIAALPLGIGAILSLLLLPATHRQSSEAVQTTPSQAKTWQKLFTRPLVLAYSLQFALLITNGVAASVWSLYMLDRGASLPVIGLSYTTFALPIILIAPLAGRLSDHYGRYRVLLLGLLLSGITFCLYALPLSPLLIVAFSVLEGVATAIARAPVDGLLVDVMPIEMKGKVQGLYSTLGTGGSFFGSTLAGFLYLIAPGTPFLAEGVLYLAVCIILLIPGLARLFPVRSSSQK